MNFSYSSISRAFAMRSVSVRVSAKIGSICSCTCFWIDAVMASRKGLGMGNVGSGGNDDDGRMVLVACAVKALPKNLASFWRRASASAFS